MGRDKGLGVGGIRKEWKELRKKTICRLVVSCHHCLKRFQNVRLKILLPPAFFSSLLRAVNI